MIFAAIAIVAIVSLAIAYGINAIIAKAYDKAPTATTTTTTTPRFVRSTAHEVSGFNGYQIDQYTR